MSKRKKQPASKQSTRRVVAVRLTDEEFEWAKGTLPPGANLSAFAKDLFILALSEYARKQRLVEELAGG